MIVITGAAGFIGSCLASFLNDKGHTDLILVDDFNKIYKEHNWEKIAHAKAIDRLQFLEWFKENHHLIEVVFHLGARTDTTEQDVEIFNLLNLNYSKSIWKICALHDIPLIYASSAATYGLGEYGFDDNHSIIPQLKPLNPYGDSKQQFDIWALSQPEQPPFWAGLKFFNVYGPNEYHKARMASVVFHAFNQISANSSMRLFKSHKIGYADGEQRRDFIYVKDVINVCYFLWKSRPESGIYNLGSGKARSFLDLAKATFMALGMQPHIEFIDTPADIRQTYQYFTEANMSKLKNVGYTNDFFSLEDGINDYVTNYLLETKYL